MLFWKLFNFEKQIYGFIYLQGNDNDLVTQLCLTLCNPMDCSPSGSSVHGFLQARILERVAMPSSRNLPNPGFKPRSPTSQADFLLSEPPGKPYLSARNHFIKWRCLSQRIYFNKCIFMDIVENLQKFLALLATPPSNLGLLFLSPSKAAFIEWWPWVRHGAGHNHSPPLFQLLFDCDGAPDADRHVSMLSHSSHMASPRDELLLSCVTKVAFYRPWVADKVLLFSPPETGLDLGIFPTTCPSIFLLSRILVELLHGWCWGEGSWCACCCRRTRLTGKRLLWESYPKWKAGKVHSSRSSHLFQNCSLYIGKFVEGAVLSLL